MTKAAYVHGYWRYPLHRAERFLRASLQPAWFHGLAIGNLGLGVIWKARREATETYRAVVGAAHTMPWDAVELEDWVVAALNHYHVSGRRHLFVVMIRGDRWIKAEGADEALVWADLREQARRPEAVA